MQPASHRFSTDLMQLHAPAKDSPERKEVLEEKNLRKKFKSMKTGILYGVDVRMGHKTGFYVD